MLQKEIPGLIPVDVSDSKEKRTYAASFVFESGNIYFPINRKYAEETIEELIMFPNGKYDDIVDTCTQAINRSYRHQGQMIRAAL
jgi:predicted phage terminase large subunit-like protein